jgi:hypothetical protein
MYRETHPTHPSRENLFSRIHSYASLLRSSPEQASEVALGADAEQLVELLESHGTSFLVQVRLEAIEHHVKV